jgi:hypothetical protein
MPANCPDHGLTAEGHCEEMEKMLEEVPGDFCEGEGDSPRHAVERLRLAYEEACEERDEMVSVLKIMADKAPDEWTKDIAARTLEGSIGDWLKAHATPSGSVDR